MTESLRGIYDATGSACVIKAMCGWSFREGPYSVNYECAEATYGDYDAAGDIMAEEMRMMEEMAIEAEGYAEHEMEEIYADYGQPEAYQTDNGPPFNSEAFARFSMQNGIQHTDTPIPPTR